MADGLPGIYFQTSEHEIWLNKDERQLSQLFIYGQTVNPITIDTVGPYTVIIFHLYPPAIKTLFGIDAHELTNTCIEYEYLTGESGRGLKNQLLELNCTTSQLRILKEALWKLLQEVQPATDNGIFYATKTIMESGGLISLGSLQKQLQVSERTFQRQFRQHVGVSPSQFKGIIRFHLARNNLENHNGNLSQLAYRHGFSDQSHFIRVFKEFTRKNTY